MDINYEYYRIFYYVAKYKNFTQAANVLMNNQPNVTRIIKLLEKELGCTLFVRSNRGVQLTPEGEKLYAHIRIAVEQIQAGEEELAMERGLHSGAVSIGVTEVALRCLLLPALEEYRRRYPGVRLRISNFTTPQAVSALQNGSVDIAVVTTPAGDTKALRMHEIKTFREVAVCGPDLKYLAEKEISLSELAKYPIISLGGRTKTYEFYAKWFLENGVPFSADIEAATADQILPLVRKNLGIGFVPEEFLESEGFVPDIHILKLRELIPSRSICCMKRMDQPLSIAARELERMILNQP